MVCFFSSLNFYHSIFFTLFVGPIPVTYCRFFFFPQYPNSPNLVEKKKKKKPKTNRSERKKKKKKKKKKRKKEPNSQPREEKKKSQKWSKVAARYCLWVSYVCLITILPLSYELWKLKTAKMCFQFP